MKKLDIDTNAYPKYVWAVVSKEFKGCLDIRRYAFHHSQAVRQLRHCKNRKSGYKSECGKGIWTLFKLVRVNKRKE